MRVRRLSDSDLESVLSLWNRNMRYDQLTPELLEEKVWDDPDFAPELAYVVEHESHLIGFIMGLVRKGTPEPIGYIKMLVIDEKYQRKGIGGRLLREIEKMICSTGVKTIRIFEAAPNYLMPGLDVRYTKAMIFFERNGYERFGETYNLETNLAGQHFDTANEEKQLKTDGIDIRRAADSDKDQVTEFLREHWAAWINEVSESFKNNPVSLHLAFYQGALIGFSAHSCNNKNTGWFGPMGTAPASRGKGIGGILLKRCLQDIKEQGRRFATIPWVGPIGFYLHYAGSEIDRVFYRYQKVFVQ